MRATTLGWLGALALLAAAHAQAACVHRRAADPQVPHPSRWLTVVDGVTGEPLPDVEVRWCPGADPDPRAELPLDPLERGFRPPAPDIDELEALVSASGATVRSDARGRVALPEGADAIRLVARRGRSFAAEQWGAGWSRREAVLALWPDGDLRVRVLDVDGIAAPGVGVALVRREVTPGDPILWHEKAVQRSVSGDDGLAVLEHAAVSIASATDGSRNHAGEHRPIEWRVALECVPLGGAFRRVEPSALPRDPIAIRLPACGELELELKEVDGRSARFELELLLVGPEDRLQRPSTWNLRSFGSRMPGTLRARVVDGKALFRNVQVGGDVIVHGARNAVSRADSLRLAGPQRAGERVRASWVPGRDAIVLVARVVQPDGSPPAPDALLLELLNGPSPGRNDFAGSGPSEFLARGRSRVASDSGWLALELDPDLAREGPPHLLVCAARRGLAPLEALVQLEPHWSPGIHDLGEIALDLPAVLAAGSVVDARGAPVEGAVVECGGGNRRSPLRGTADARGVFELRSAVPVATVDLGAHAPGFLRMRALHGPSGRTDWRIVLARECKLVARVATPPGVVASQLRIVLRSPAGQRVDLRADATGLVVAAGLTPGIHALVVLASHELGTGRVAIPEVRLKSGATTDVGTLTVPVQ